MDNDRVCRNATSWLQAGCLETPKSELVVIMLQNVQPIVVRCVKDVQTSIDKISASAKAVSTKIYTISGAPVRNNMETLAKGIYVKKTVYDNGQISVEKLIKKQD